MTIIIEAIIILLLSAFFSGMEIAFVSSGKLRFEMDKANKNINTRVLSVFYARPNNFITTLLVGNNIALVIYGILMAAIIEQYILRPAGFIEEGAMMLAIQTFISTLFVLVLGEFIPKTVFRINPYGMMRAFAVPAFFFYVILYPISKFTIVLSRFLLRTAGVNVGGKRVSRPFKKVDLNHLVQSNIDEAKGEQEVEEEIKLFRNALEFRNVKVRECIVPRTEVNAVSIDASFDVLMGKFIESGNSKIVVYEDDIDNIVGFVHSIEMFNLENGAEWTAAIKEVSVVPETMSAQKLLQSMLQQKKSIAVVVDEFGGTSGIVTLEDLVEEIFGEIEDEYDKDTYVAKSIGDGEYLLSARLEIDAVNEMFDLDLPRSDEYLTIGGLILHERQSFPKHNETIKFDKWEFRILKNTSTKIELVALKVVR